MTFCFWVKVRRPDGRHHAFGPGTEHAEHLDCGHEAVDQLRQLEFVLVEQTGHRSAGLEHLDHPVTDRGVVAAQHRRAARLQEVNIAVAVHVPEIGALRFFDRHGEGIVEGQVVLDAAGDEPLGFIGQLLRAGAPRAEVVQVGLHFLAPHPAHGLGDQSVQAAVNVVDIGIFGNGVLLSLGHRGLPIQSEEGHKGLA
jgi:hypothetical protein